MGALTLDGIKGVGAKTREALIRGYGSEEAVLEAFSNQVFDRLFFLEELAPQTRVQIAREVYSHKKCFGYQDLLRTPDATRIYNQVMGYLKGLASTDHGRLALGLYYPTLDREELEARFKTCTQALAFIMDIPNGTLKDMRSHLKRVHPLREPSRKVHVNATIATGDREVFHRLKSLSGNSIFLEGEEDLQYIETDGFPVVFIQGKGPDLSVVMERIPGVEYRQEFSEVEVAPELVIELFRDNREVISSALALAGIVGDTENNPLSGGDPGEFQEVTSILEGWGDGDLGLLDPALQTLQDAEANLERVMDECLKETNEAIAERVEKEAVALKGRAVLDILADLEGGRVYQRLPEEITTIMTETATQGERECAKRLGLQDDMVLFTGLFSSPVKYPLEASQERLRELASWVRQERSRAETRLKRETASTLEKHRTGVEALVRSVLDFDAFLALGIFCRDFSLSKPEVVDEGALVIEKGRHLGLIKDCLSGGQAPQPVDYHLGTEDRAAVLTGANSGGKTSLLETIAQVLVMGQCGLFVPAAKAKVPLVDGLYYFGKSRGDTGAGAFEALLRSFEALEGQEGRRLVLADEIEAVTEPGAAAVVISSILEALVEDGHSLAVLVTHLGEDVMKEVGPGVRVDGIEARGLDAELNLVVDRNPVLNHLARSTPELIVERLKKQGDDYGFYERISKRFKKE